MDSRDQQVEAVSAMLRAAGAKVGIDPNVPDEVKRAFLEMILSCPDCREAIRGKHEGRDN